MKIVISDLDGTLINSGGQLGDRLAFMKQAREAKLNHDVMRFYLDPRFERRFILTSRLERFMVREDGIDRFYDYYKITRDWLAWKGIPYDLLDMRHEGVVNTDHEKGDRLSGYIRLFGVENITFIEDYDPIINDVTSRFPCLIVYQVIDNKWLILRS